MPGLFEKKRKENKLPDDVSERIDRLPIRALPDSDFDEFGLSREFLKKITPFGIFLYKKWFRVDLHGIENIPADGPVIIVSNHSGQLPLDGAMITVACILEMDPPRLPRSMIEKWFPTLPHASVLMQRAGQVVGVMENADRLLENSEMLMVFPEGAKGSGKTWDKRYQLQKFNIGFMELAIRHKAPIVPVAVIGGEEQAPNFYNVEPLAKKLGMLYFPLTPTFPWLGLLGFIPLPSKYHIYIGEPMAFSAYSEHIDDPEKIKIHVEQVRGEIQEMINLGLKERPFPGF